MHGFLPNYKCKPSVNDALFALVGSLKTIALMDLSASVQDWWDINFQV